MFDIGFEYELCRFMQRAKTFVRVSTIKMAVQMRFVEAKRKLFMCSFLKLSLMMLRI